MPILVLRFEIFGLRPAVTPNGERGAGRWGGRGVQKAPGGVIRAERNGFHISCAVSFIANDINDLAVIMRRLLCDDINRAVITR